MGEKIILTLHERVVHGKKVAKLREQDIVPVVVYGAGMEPYSAQASVQDIEKVVRAAGRHTPIHLTLNDKKKIAMVKELGVDPAKNRINHVAFHAVKQNQAIEAEVPIRLVGEGESEAEKAGLIILQNIDTLEVKALPLEMPDALELDIRHLKEPGERVLVGDIHLPDNVELVEHSDGRDDEDDETQQGIVDLVVASVWEPSALQAANESAAGSSDGQPDEVPADQGSDEPASETSAKE